MPKPTTQTPQRKPYHEACRSFTNSPIDTGHVLAMAIAIARDAQDALAEGDFDRASAGLDRAEQGIYRAKLDCRVHGSLAAQARIEARERGEA